MLTAVLKMVNYIEHVVKYQNMNIVVYNKKKYFPTFIFNFFLIKTSYNYFKCK